MSRRFDPTLVFVTDRRLAEPRGIAATVAAAVAGGATLVQLRDPGAKTRDFVAIARELLTVLRPLGVPLVVNDRVDVALAAGADGVHVGQSDMSVADARRLIGPDAILGLSITDVSQLAASDLDSVDYLGVGPVFATSTKPDAAPPMGVAGLEAVVVRTSIPVVAIGGIHAGNAALAIMAGAGGIAVVSAIAAARDAEGAARDILNAVKSARGASAN